MFYYQYGSGGTPHHRPSASSTQADVIKVTAGREVVGRPTIVRVPTHSQRVVGRPTIVRVRAHGRRVVGRPTIVQVQARHWQT